MTGSFQPPKRHLMGPGPSDVHERILAAMARPTIGHLDPAFVEMMEQMLKDARRTEIEQGRTAKREKVMYSQAIDEAVKENTPAW